MPERIEQLAGQIAGGYGCSAECTYYFGPSPLINEHENLNRLAAQSALEELGEGSLASQPKPMGAEDFSVYMEHIPGVFGYLGVRNREKGIECIAHHPAFAVDEDVLYHGTGIYVRFALNYLNEEAGA